MPTVQQHLIFKALVAVDEAVNQRRHGPITPGFALRFALAYLFATGDGYRPPYDQLWEALLRKPSGEVAGAGPEKYCGSRDASLAFDSIIAGFKIMPTPDITACISDGRDAEKSDQATAFWAAVELQRELGGAKRWLASLKRP